jgi:hypothetical protein
MRFHAFTGDGTELRTRTYYSVGGGFIVNEDAHGPERIKADDTVVTYPFRTGDELLAQCRHSGLPISEVMLANESAWRNEREVHAGLLRIWDVMQHCVLSGCSTPGVEGPSSRAGPAARAGLGHALRAGSQRGERIGRSSCHGSHQRSCRDHPRGAALLHPMGARCGRRRRGALPAHRRREHWPRFDAETLLRSGEGRGPRRW